MDIEHGPPSVEVDGVEHGNVSLSLSWILTGVWPRPRYVDTSRMELSLRRAPSEPWSEEAPREAGKRAFAGLRSSGGVLHGALKHDRGGLEPGEQTTISPHDPDAFERLVNLYEDAFTAFGIDRTAGDAGVDFAVRQSSACLPAFHRAGLKDRFSSNPNSSASAKATPRSNAAHDLEFMSLTFLFLEGSKKRALCEDGLYRGVPQLTFAGAQRHALDEMRRLFGKEKVGSPKTMKRVWNRKQIRKTDEPDQLKDEPELFWQIAVMDELYFQDLLRRAFKAVLDPEFMEARAFARGRGNRGTVGQ